MTTAWKLAEALTTTLVRPVHEGAEQTISNVEITDSSQLEPFDPSDLLLAVGFAAVSELIETLNTETLPGGVVVRAAWADSGELRTAFHRADVTLLALAPEATWSGVSRLLRTLLGGTALLPDQNDALADDASNLFDLADTISALLAAPVTIEDEHSHVVAYSTGQTGVDSARMDTILGRKVPDPIRNHFRSLGVFRRVSRSREPFHVAAATGELKGRYIVPVHAGGQWLGAVWAVTDVEGLGELRKDIDVVVELIALHMLRRRVEGSLAEQVHLDRVRTILWTGEGALDEKYSGPWTVALLDGPDTNNLDPEARSAIWSVLARRKGWRQPLIADLDGRVYAILRTSGDQPGTWTWLSNLTRAGQGNNRISLTLGGIADSLAQVPQARSQADELNSLSAGRTITTMEDVWPRLVLDRATRNLDRHSPASPLETLLAGADEAAGSILGTLAAVIDHWGEPRKAARVLDVHPNTIRNQKWSPFFGQCLKWSARRIMASTARRRAVLWRPNVNVGITHRSSRPRWRWRL